MKIICIFCGEEKESSKEHIIPNAICATNKNLTIENVCKDCNSELGATIDSKFVNSPAIEFKRAALKQRGYKSDSSPQPFKHGIDSDGNKIKLHPNFEPEIIPNINKVAENNYTISGNSEKEVDDIAKKMAKRLNKVYKRTSLTESNLSKVTLCYKAKFDISYFEVEFLKIAFEYMNKYYADIYKQDPIGNDLKKILNKFKAGQAVNYSSYLRKLPSSENSPLLDNFNKTKAYHLIITLPGVIQKDDLWIAVSLYNGAFSYAVLVSNNKVLYPEMTNKPALIDIRQ